jgi:predicted secreted hydrolase
MIIFAHNQNMLALHFLQIDTADNDNKGLNWFDHAFHGKHALAVYRLRRSAGDVTAGQSHLDCFERARL